MGHSVGLLTSVPANVYIGIDPNALINNLEIVKLRSFNFIPNDLQYVSPIYIRDTRKVKRILYQEDYDIIILNDYFWTLSFVALLLMGRRNRSRIIMINHGIISPPGYFFRFIFKLFSIVVSRIFITQFKGILSYSNRTYKELEKILPASLKHIVHPSCIDYSKFRADYDRSLSTSSQEIREKFRISGSFIFSISSISPHKGYEVLINAFSHLLEQYPNIDLVLAGQMTQYGKQLRKLCDDLGISKNVRFVGTISDPEKFNLMMKSTIFVIPSLREGFGAGAMEADVLQVKVVATDTGAHKEILSGNRFSRIVETGNSIELYNAIDDLISIKEEPARTLDVAKLCRYSCESLCEAILSEFT